MLLAWRSLNVQRHVIYAELGRTIDMVYTCIQYFWQGNHQTYGQIRCMYMVMANPTYTVHGVYVWFRPAMHDSAVQGGVKCLRAASRPRAALLDWHQKVLRSSLDKCACRLCRVLHICMPCIACTSYMYAVYLIRVCRVLHTPKHAASIDRFASIKPKRMICRWRKGRLSLPSPRPHATWRNLGYVRTFSLNPTNYL